MGGRPGSGRKRKANAIRHDARPEVSRHKPVHVSLRTHRDVGRLRRRDAYRAVRAAVATCLGRADFRIVHVSIQSNHIHLLVEADAKRALANGLRAFMISGAKRLNAFRGRRGQVFTQRYHAVHIGSPLQARRALAYVLNNWRRHREDVRGAAEGRASVDPYSTAVLFDGWESFFRDRVVPWRIGAAERVRARFEREVLPGYFALQRWYEPASISLAPRARRARAYRSPEAGVRKWLRDGARRDRSTRLSSRSPE